MQCLPIPICTSVCTVDRTAMWEWDCITAHVCAVMQFGYWTLCYISTVSSGGHTAEMLHMLGGMNLVELSTSLSLKTVAVLSVHVRQCLCSMAPTQTEVPKNGILAELHNSTEVDTNPKSLNLTSILHQLKGCILYTCSK